MKLLLISIACGIVITVVLTATAFSLSIEAGRVILWQVTLLSILIGPGPLIGHDAQGNPEYEGTPVHMLAFFVGILLGVPIYSLLSYVVLRRLGKRRRPS